MRFHNLSPQPDIGANSYLVEGEGVRIVLDSGTHPKHTGWETLPLLDHLESDCLDGILVSHPHLDHLGSLPVLMRSQPSAEVVTTRLTREYGTALLHNSVNVMKAQAEELDEPLYPLYTHSEVDMIARRWNLRDVGNRFFPGDQSKLSAEFFHAGHVLGAAGIRIEVGGKKLFFTGDVHFEDQTLVKAAEFPRDPVDTLVMETTRGASPRDPSYTREAEKERFAKAITETLARGGSVMVPVFAFGKTQEVLLMLRELFDEGRLPIVPVHIGGLSTKITEITDRFSNAAHRRHVGYNILNDFPSLKRLAKGRREPDYQPGAIYALSSGMMTEHTVSHRFAHRILASEQNSLLFVGYADPDSPGGLILTAGQGGRVVLSSKSEKETEIRCQVERFDFSGHAPREQLVDYAVACRPGNILLVHGDPAAKQWFQGELARLLPDSRILIPTSGEVIDL